MTTIKCPHCGESFQLDKSAAAHILAQVRDDELKRQVEERVQLIASTHAEELKLQAQQSQAELQQLEAQLRAQSQQEQAELKANIHELEHKLKQEQKQHEQERELALMRATSERDLTIEKLRAELSGEQAHAEQLRLNYQQQLAERDAFKDKIIQEKDGEIERLRDQKARLSTKMLGESLEQHCEIEFNRWRSTAFQGVEFHKDNSVVEGRKGDYIYRECDEDGVEILSIMFEMKNEADDSSHKHKNESFLKKLDSDRRNKSCEYAVLVTMLEPDNEFYNAGIADLSFHYEKMYAIRPQFFIPLISLLRNSARSNLDLKRELLRQQQENIDITNFEQAMEEFKEKFGKNVTTAKNKFDAAIDEIDKAIARLQKVKENLKSSENQLRLADDKAQGLTIKKLTKNSPSMRTKFAQLQEAPSKDSN